MIATRCRVCCSFCGRQQQNVIHPSWEIEVVVRRDLAEALATKNRPTRAGRPARRDVVILAAACASVLGPVELQREVLRVAPSRPARAR